MLVFMLSGLGVLLVGLLLIRRLQFQPAGMVESTAAAWEQPSLAARAEPPPAQMYTERDMGPSTREIATGVFLGIWMFTLSAAGVAVTVTVLFGSLSGITD